MDLIAEGRTAEVLAVGPDRVLKLLKPGFSEDLLALESDKTSAAHAADAPAPAVLGRRTVAGRPGLLMERAGGRSMADEIRRRPWTAARWGDRLADLHAEVTGRTSFELPDVKDRLAAAIDDADLPTRHRAAAKAALVGLPDDDRVLHGDFHPFNVMVDADRLTVIDWVDAARGAPAADVARTMWLLSPEALPPDLPMRFLVSSVGGFVRRGYARRMPSIATPEEVAAWRLPVVAARVAEEIPYEHDALRIEVERLVV